MSMLTFESQMAGMPSGRKKTRRAGKNHKSKGPPGDPAKHIENVQAALAADDHATAKTHAFALMRSLHAQAPGQPKAPAAKPLTPSASTNLPASAMTPGESTDDAAAAARARLARTLHGLGK